MNRVIPIAVEPQPGSPKQGRFALLHAVHRVVAGTIAAVPPLAVGGYFLWKFLSNSAEGAAPLMSNFWAMTVIVGLWVVVVARSVACTFHGLRDMGLVFLFTFLSYLLGWVGLVPESMGSSFGAATLLTLVAFLMGLALATWAYESLRAGHEKPLSDSERALINKKCNTCVVASLCPFQPGAFLDQYKRS